MVLPWDKDFLSSEKELSSKTILYASEGQNVNNVSRSIVKKILGNIDSKDYSNLPLEEIASQNFIWNKKWSKVFDQIEQAYQVPATVLLALWGIETSYGSMQGDIPTLSALATLVVEQ